MPTGNVETVEETLSGATSDTRATTIETVTIFTGPCRVRARRSSQYDYTFSGVVVDEIKFADLYSVSPVDKTDFGNVTTIHGDQSHSDRIGNQAASIELPGLQAASDI